ncbi:S8 family peptidase [Dyadobacter sp. 32]|uniref:S8 family peptidase n=1 Tax=Dyadobacter sp. 32 TaxID=538966 RepID=UPI0011EC6FA0
MNRRYILLIISLFLCGINLGNAQSNPRYLILFKDKAGSPYSVNKPNEYLSARSIERRARQKIQITENDFPVNPAYVVAVKQTGAAAIFPSRWFNGLVVEASASQLEAIKKLSFFKGIELNLPIANITSKSPGVERSLAIHQKFETTEDIDYGRMRDQLALIGVDHLHQKGLHGENMLIAVFDNGFVKANEIDYFKPIFDEKRLVDSYNFLSRQSNVYEGSDPHGRNVWSTIAAYKPGTLVGAAYKASFALYTTENNSGESPYEEVTWLMAAERADSLGVDVINSSLGYYDFLSEFNTPAYNYPYSKLDGKTTIISKAARFACRKGIIVVNAAGNEGSNGWGKLVAPADVDSVLTVGSTDYLRNRAANSSLGPNAAGQLKPDVAAVGVGAIIGNSTGGASSSSGTSFASPQIAGLAAILWQGYPNLTSQQIISVLKKSGHQASKPDTLLGYGVPDGELAEAIILTDYPILGAEIEVLHSVILSPNPVQDNLILNFPASMTGNATFTIIHSNGVELSRQRKTVQSQTELNTGHLNSGLYLLRIHFKNQISTLKFLKE